MPRWKSAPLACVLTLNILASTASAVVTEEAVTPSFLHRNPKSFEIKAGPLQNGLLQFEINRHFVRPTYVVATVIVRNQNATIFESHFPAFVQEDSTKYTFALPPEYVANSTFDLSERSFAKSGRDAVPLPGGTDYRINLSDFDEPKTPENNGGSL